ncbi:hypothetical protein Pcinc_031725 [Petrolisthes cinctipes]|uniref:LysM domain-containing protein n=1 Tax=Petrolisthes cinctipes TaxID=88211 RepID=A0AAE1EVM2_PETCI|nr:hypothetical protein Pcinc_031725 [Petrolisthes cinctipes]
MAASSEEKGLLGAAARPHRRYGTTTTVNMKKPQHQQQHILKHRVSKHDTLQGIALKYGVSMESIKQHNKLWSGEAMFLHDYLDVPVSRTVYEALSGGPEGVSPLLSSTHTSPLTSDSRSSEGSQNTSCTSTTSSPPPPQSPKQQQQQQQQSTQSQPSTPSTPSGLHDCSETDPTDFLSKIDSNIALMRTSIERMETHAYPMVDRMEVDDSCCHTTRGNDNTTNNGSSRWHSAARQNVYHNGYHDPTSAPHPVVTPGRTITMSLKRLLRDHEELYEL